MRISSELIIDLKQLAANFQSLKKLAPNNEIIFMVKANAYGHGLTAISKYAFENLHIKKFGCASLGEALEIRKVITNTECEIYIFSDLELENEFWKDHSDEVGIIPVLSDLSQLDFVLAAKHFDSTPMILKFNTGMNRLGIQIKEVDQVISKLQTENRLCIKHLMTHFSSSFLILKDGNRTHRQYDEFKLLKQKILDSGINIQESSVSNSGAIEQGFGLAETHIRPGLMLYGPKSVGSFKHKNFSLWEGKSISKLKTKIIRVEAVNKGAPIGYGAHVCHGNGVIAFLPLGYGDGILTYYTGSILKHLGLTGKILGRINMDLMAVFFEGESLDQTAIKVGQDFLIWDTNQDDVVDLASQSKSIPYQVFTAISSRVPRHYIS